MTDEKITDILRTVALGIWPDRAARIHGISAATMRKHKQRHPEFVTALEKAESEAESSIHGKILKAMDKSWQAAAWMLERRWPNRYAKREPEVQVTVSQEVNIKPDGPPVPVDGHLLDYAKKLTNIVDSLESKQGGKMLEAPGTNGTTGSA